MSGVTGFNQLTDANKYGVESFRRGQEGFNALKGFLANTTQATINETADNVFNNSIFNQSELTNLSNRLNVFIKEIGKENLTTVDEAVRITAKDFYKCFKSDVFKNDREALVEEAVSELTFGELTRGFANIGAIKKGEVHVDQFPDFLKIYTITLLETFLSAAASPDSVAQTKSGKFGATHVAGEKFDDFTGLLSSTTYYVQIAALKFLEEASEEEMTNFKAALQAYKAVFAKEGTAKVASEEVRNTILLNIGKVEEALRFENIEGSFEDVEEDYNLQVETFGTLRPVHDKVKAELQTVLKAGVKGIGEMKTEWTTWFGLSKTFKPGPNYALLGSLLLTSKGHEVINEAITTADRKETVVIRAVLNRFQEGFLFNSLKATETKAKEPKVSVEMEGVTAKPRLRAQARANTVENGLRRAFRRLGPSEVELVSRAPSDGPASSKD